MRIVKASELDFNTPQTPGMTRAAAINFAKAGASKLWAGTVNEQPNANTGGHHHGLSRASSTWSRAARACAGASASSTSPRRIPAASIYVPPYVPHQKINAGTDEPLECVLVRSDQEPVVVDLDIEPAEHPEEVRWINPNHPQG